MTLSEQARADAMADAETLRWFLRQYLSPFDWRFRSGLCYRYPRRGSLPDPVHSIHAAHAAFLAIPGLRG